MYVLDRFNAVRISCPSQHGEDYTNSDLRADQIDKQSLEISQAADEIYSSMQDLADELPGHSPRFVLLSYPLTLVSTHDEMDYRPLADNIAGLWTSLSTICTALLSTRYLQRRAKNVVRWGQRVDEEHRGSRESN